MDGYKVVSLHKTITNMRKRNKLYTANKWNQPLFAKGMDRDHYNILDGMYQSTLNTPTSGGNGFRLSSAPQWYSTPQLSQPNVQMPVDWDNGVQRSQALGQSAALVSNFGNAASNSNIFSKIGGSGGSGGSGLGWAAAAQTAATALLNTPAGDKALDTMDPVYHLAGGRESTVGNGLSTAGKATFKSGVASGNPYTMAAGAGLKVVGGLVNAAFGMKTDQTALNNANNAINYYRNFKSNATDFEDIQGPVAMASFKNPYKGGWFTGGKARRKNRELQEQYQQEQSYANRSVDNNIDNIANTQMDNLMANYAAFGGPIGNGGAIDYGFMSDYLTTKNRAASIKDKASNNIFGSLASTPFFALGGDIQSNGADWSTGLDEVNAGKSHEENPYGGVQVGKDSNGTPNLVEEGETIFDDYVYSNRIKVDRQTKDKFHISKNADMTFAELSKKLQRESEERPNDAISQRGLTKQMHALAEEQERQKSEQQAARAQEMFNSLPPEQQAEIMQQIAMQEQQANAQAQQQQAAQPMEGMEQPTEGQMTEQPMQGQQEEQPMPEGEMNACGGKINRYDKGGDMKRKIYSLLPNVYTDSDFDKWAYDQKLDKITDWENITKNKAFMGALAGVNPIVADAISRGYDFGAYKPSANNNLTFDFTHGGWGREDYDAWKDSKDAAWIEAKKKGLVREGMNSEEIGNALKQTDAYKRGTQWLMDNEDNRLRYLQAIYNSNDAPEAAKTFAGKYVDANGWLKDAKRDYQTIFEDPNGTGVRNTHPGTYWKTPNEVLRGNQVTNYVVNGDGSIEEIVGDVPKEWTKANSLSWQTDETDNTANYYNRPVVAEDNANNKKEETVLEPVHKTTIGRTLGLLGPAVGLGMQMAGIGKPDYSRMDAALDIASEAPALAHYKPIGNYLGYNPMDIWFEQSRMDANSRATDRAIMNNASTIGTKNAGLLANGYNRMIADGSLYRQALEYNDAQRQKVAEFNRGTDMYNADAFTKTSAANAEIQNRQRQLRAQMGLEAANQRMAADASWNQGIYGNVTNLFQGLGDWGKENAQHNMIADMAADGIFGTISDKQNIGKGYLVRRVPKKKACGGKIKRKRGLTF